MFSGFIFFFNCSGMFCKVANELANKNPQVKIATLHPVMWKIAYVCISCFALSHSEKKCSTNSGDI